MKTLKQIREDYNSRFLTQDSEELVLEKSSIPSNKEMPALIVFRRVSYRAYPKGQTVALYYSNLMDKYLSIPVGPVGNVNLSEDQFDEGILDTVAGAAGGLLDFAKKAAEKVNKGINAIGKDETKDTKKYSPTAKKTSSWEKKPSSIPSKDVKMKQAELDYMKKSGKTPPKEIVKENRITDLRRMIEEGIDSKDLYINGRSVTLNTSMAKRILEVYDSVNTKNKKIVESMLNEDLESFKKLLNFSVRN